METAVPVDMDKYAASDAAAKAAGTSKIAPADDGASAQNEAPAKKRGLSIWDLEGGSITVETHGRQVELAENALCCMGPESAVRKKVIDIVYNPWFDRMVLFIIMLNAIVMGLVDYSNVETENRAEMYQPVAEGSWRNSLVSSLELFFTVVFTLECVSKTVAMGFYFSDGAYLRDPWNILDFVVVVTGLMSLLPNMPNVSAIRTFRVLRPLKSLSAIPGLQKLVVGILAAMPALGSVVVLLVFVFTIFGILGLQLYKGAFHTRCRTTPWPVDFTWDGDCNPAVNGGRLDYNYSCAYEHRCLKETVDTFPFNDLKASNFDVEKDHFDWTLETSPWNTRQACQWPIAPPPPNSETGKIRTCTHENGANKCHHDTTRLPRDLFTWCGANYDFLGNERFIFYKADGTKKPRTSIRLSDGATYIEDLNWGMTTFDSFPRALLTIFQSVTLEGWSDIMFFAQDSVDPLSATAYFVILTLFGGFFALNLVLAVLENEYGSDEHDDDDAKSGGGSPRPAGEGAPDDGGLDENAAIAKWANALGAFFTKGEGLAHQKTKLYATVTGDAVTTLFTLLILGNTIVLALDHFPMDNDGESDLEMANFFFTMCFLVEMVLKLAVLGVREYGSDSYNIFDAVIVLSSIVDLGLSPPSFLVENSGGGGGISAMRSFRLFRVFKLAKSWETMDTLLKLIFKTVIDIGNFAMLLFLFMYIYTLLGMGFFANRMRFDEDGYKVNIHNHEAFAVAEVPRSHFDSFLWGFTTVFQVLSGENWNAAMYDGWRATNWNGVWYYLSLIVFGMFIVMNLFLAILLSNFSSEDEDEDEAEAKPASNQIAPEEGAADAADDKPEGLHRSSVSQSLRELDGPNEEKETIFPLDRGKALFLFGPDHPVRENVARIVDRKEFDQTVLVLIIFSSVLLALDTPLLNPAGGLYKALNILDYVMTTLFTIEMVLKMVATGALMLPHAYLKNGWNILDFIVVIISLIGVFTKGQGGFSALKALRALRSLRPLRMINRAPGLKVVVDALLSSIPATLNVVCVCVLFFLIFAIFCVNYWKGALRSCQGDVFDGVIAPSDGVEGADYYATMFDAPKWADMSPDQRATFGPSSVFEAAGFVDYAGLDCKTDLGWDAASADTSYPCWYAADAAAWALKEGVRAMSPVRESMSSRDVCEAWGGEWAPDIFQLFDNSPQALLTLFEISTTEGWVDVMYATVDTRGIDMHPQRDVGENWVWFWMFFMMAASYLFLNLFVGVTIDNFNNVKKENEEGGSIFQTKTQKMWIKTHHSLFKINPARVITPPHEEWKKPVFELVMSVKFELFIMFCIICNTAVMAMDYFGQSTGYANFLETLNYIFAFIFTAEMVLKLIGMRMGYFADQWNRFDCFIVLATIAGILVKLLAGADVGSIATVIRTFRVGRALRLVQGAKSMKQLFNTLILTLPGLINIGALLALLFFIYAVVGVQLFAEVAFTEDHDEHVNFRNFWRSMVVLLRFSTGENWNGFMHSMSLDVDGCVTDPEYDEDMCGYRNSPNCVPINGCGNPAIFLYLVTFTLAIALVFVNLFIGVILEGFDSADEEKKLISEGYLDAFKQCWAKFDPHATCLLDIPKFRMFLDVLEAPWGFGPEYMATEIELDRKIASLSLTIYTDPDDGEKKLHFKDVLLALAKEVMKKRVYGDEVEDEIQELKECIAGEYTLLKVMAAHFAFEARGFKPSDDPKKSVRYEFAARRIQNAWKRIVARVKGGGSGGGKDGGYLSAFSFKATPYQAPADGAGPAAAAAPASAPSQGASKPASATTDASAAAEAGGAAASSSAADGAAATTAAPGAASSDAGGGSGGGDNGAANPSSDAPAEG